MVGEFRFSGFYFRSKHNESFFRLMKLKKKSNLLLCLRPPYLLFPCAFCLILALLIEETTINGTISTKRGRGGRNNPKKHSVAPEYLMFGAKLKA